MIKQPSPVQIRSIWQQARKNLVDRQDPESYGITELDVVRESITLIFNKMTNPNLDNIYMYHAPHGDQAERYQVLRSAAKDLAQLMINSTPESRERSIALTNLEQAVFWVNAAIARNESPES